MSERLTLYHLATHEGEVLCGNPLAFFIDEVVSAREWPNREPKCKECVKKARLRPPPKLQTPKIRGPRLPGP